MDYGRTIKRALDITWRHKVLWLFGILAVLFGEGSMRNGSANPGAGANMLQYRFSNGDIERWRRSAPPLPKLPFGPWQGQGMPSVDWQAILPIVIVAVVALLVVGLIVFILGIIVRYTSLGALMGVVDSVESSESASFRGGLRAGWPHVLRLFAIDLLIGLGTFVAVLVLIAVLVIGAVIVVGPAIAIGLAGKGMVALAVVWGVGTGIGLLTVFVLLVVALTALVTLVREFSFRAAVLDRQGILASLGTGLAQLRQHKRESVLMWLLLLCIRIGLGLVTVPLALISAVGLLGPALATYRLTNSIPAAIAAALPFVAVLGLVALLFAGIYMAFRSAVWTLTYRELRQA